MGGGTVGLPSTATWPVRAASMSLHAPPAGRTACPSDTSQHSYKRVHHSRGQPPGGRLARNSLGRITTSTRSPNWCIRHHTRRRNWRSSDRTLGRSRHADLQYAGPARRKVERGCCYPPRAEAANCIPEPRNAAAPYEHTPICVRSLPRDGAARTWRRTCPRRRCQLYPRAAAPVRLKTHGDVVVITRTPVALVTLHANALAAGILEGATGGVVVNHLCWWQTHTLAHTRATQPPQGAVECQPASHRQAPPVPGSHPHRRHASGHANEVVVACATRANAG